MRPRKLQIFVSSTYEDLVEQRLAAIEAILAAGHIPATMEQFAPGDETAWDKIRRWIDESDAFILLLGGRYGSIEPNSGKSYVEIEYDYAVNQKRKPFFSIVVTKEHHNQRVKEYGLLVDERENPEKYKAFHKVVTTKLCAFWADKKDIKATIFQKLPEWAQNQALPGWIRAEDAASPALASELAKLSQENRELREQVRQAASRDDDFDGLGFEELVRALRAEGLPSGTEERLKDHWLPGLSSDTLIRHAGHLFELLKDMLAAGIWTTDVVTCRPLIAYGLAAEIGTKEARTTRAGSLSFRVGAPECQYSLTPSGRRFRSRLLRAGPLEFRLRTLWDPD